MSWGSHHTHPTSQLSTSFHAKCDLLGPVSDTVKGLGQDHSNLTLPFYLIRGLAALAETVNCSGGRRRVWSSQIWVQISPPPNSSTNPLTSLQSFNSVSPAIN